MASATPTDRRRGIGLSTGLGYETENPRKRTDASAATAFSRSPSNDPGWHPIHGGSVRDRRESFGRSAHPAAHRSHPYVAHACAGAFALRAPNANGPFGRGGGGGGGGEEARGSEKGKGEGE